MDFLQKIYALLKYAIIDRKTEISDGSTQLAYQEFTYTIPSLGVVDVFVVFNYFRVMALSGGALSIKVGDNGLESAFSGVGIGVDFEDRFRRMRLINTGGTTMTITVAFNNGHINDDRLNVSGNINSVPVGSTAITTAQTVVSNTAVLLSAASSSKKSVTIKPNTQDLYVSGSNAVTTANGFPVQVGESITISTQGDVYAIRAAAGSVAAFVMVEA